jgi:hypothetical protein
MKIKFGALVTEGRGKLGGHVASRNRSANYLRTKTSPVNPQTTSQSGVRTSFATYSQGWRSLTAVQRAAWAAVVDQFTKLNVFGDTVRLTGANLYMSLNRVIATIGGAAISTPPIASAPGGVTSLSLVADVSDAWIKATYAPAIAATDTVEIWATAPQSAGISFVKNKYRYIGKIVTADVSPYNLTALYEAKFGTGWKVAGQKVFVRFVPVVTLAGIAGTGLDSSTIVVA